MQTFATARDAKEFLIGKILTEAQREGVSVSEVERKMLYFSETAWTLPDIADVNDIFDRDYDQRQYEQKIAMLSRNFATCARKNDKNEFDSWNAAIATLSQEDHYLLVLIAAEKQLPNAPWPRFLKLLLIGGALALLALVVGYFLLGNV